jgi:hypothetical protein
MESQWLRLPAIAGGAASTAHCYSASTVMKFEPGEFQRMAGLICYYNGSKVSPSLRLARHGNVQAYPCSLQGAGTIPARECRSICELKSISSASTGLGAESGPVCQAHWIRAPFQTKRLCPERPILPGLCGRLMSVHGRHARARGFRLVRIPRARLWH